MRLGFANAGYGCMTCIGNSGEIDKAVAEQILKNDLVSVSVLSGNRNFEGRVHNIIKANYLGLIMSVHLSIADYLVS